MISDNLSSEFMYLRWDQFACGEGFRAAASGGVGFAGLLVDGVTSRALKVSARINCDVVYGTLHL